MSIGLPALLLALAGVTVQQDSAALRRAARGAEARYERTARWRAPYAAPAGEAVRCEETVGRFRLRFTEGDAALPPPVPAVIEARRAAIQTFRRAFAAAPGDFTVAGPLVRLLVEDGRAGEAASAAEAYLWASGDSTWGALLLGFALHAAGNDSAAERWFAAGLDRLPARERARWASVEHLLAPEERRLYRQWAEPDRARYEEDFWRLADPLYLTEGNEARAAHFARRVWAALLARAPVVAGAWSWGSDLEQLTIRYGVPVARGRDPSAPVTEIRLIEWYDPNQLPLAPERLALDGPPAEPAPGEPWPLDQPCPRSGYAPRSYRTLVPLPHQVSRFPAGDSVVVRVDAALALDSAARAARDFAAPAADSARAALFLLDGEYRTAREAYRTVPVRGEITPFTFAVRAAAGEYVYSVEALEGATRLAARARYRLSVEVAPPAALALSDLVVAQPFGPGRLPRGRDDPALRPRTSLVLTPADTLGLYAEAHGLARDESRTARYRVELALAPVRESALARAVRRLGRLLGLARDRALPRLAWEATTTEEGAAVVATDLSLPRLRPGLYHLALTITDLADGRRASTARLVRIERRR